jgi:hypothetical protein
VHKDVHKGGNNDGKVMKKAMVTGMRPIKTGGITMGGAMERTTMGVGMGTMTTRGTGMGDEKELLEAFKPLECCRNLFLLGKTVFLLFFDHGRLVGKSVTRWGIKEMEKSEMLPSFHG